MGEKKKQKKKYKCSVLICVYMFFEVYTFNLKV